MRFPESILRQSIFALIASIRFLLSKTDGFKHFLYDYKKFCVVCFQTVFKLRIFMLFMLCFCYRVLTHLFLNSIFLYKISNRSDYFFFCKNEINFFCVSGLALAWAICSAACFIPDSMLSFTTSLESFFVDSSA